MKISAAIATLQAIQAKFGDLTITGGYMAEDRPLKRIVVTDAPGMEVWPQNNSSGKHPLDGVFLE